jgi:hypothetical protein
MEQAKCAGSIQGHVFVRRAGVETHHDGNEWIRELLVVHLGADVDAG